MTPPELAFRTSSCGQHGHSEFTLQIARPMEPRLEHILLSYLEDAVASGSSFVPGQTLRFGWSTLRVIHRGDGTLGLEERRGPTIWTESVDETLEQTWLQKEIAVSVGLVERLAFPEQDETAMVADCALSAAMVVLARIPADVPGFSGWTASCSEAHEHGKRAFPTLLDLSTRLPFLPQFLALPTGVGVLIVTALAPPRIRAHIWCDGAERTPAEGSLLATLNGPG